MPVDIEAIRERAAAGNVSARDTTALIKEIEGLRAEVHILRGTDDGNVVVLEAEVQRLRAALLEEQTVHAKTMDNFEASSESWLEERTRLLDRHARVERQLEVERDIARTELQRLRDLILMQSTNPGGVDIGGAS